MLWPLSQLASYQNGPQVHLLERYVAIAACPRSTSTAALPMGDGIAFLLAGRRASGAFMNVACAQMMVAQL